MSEQSQLVTAESEMVIGCRNACTAYALKADWLEDRVDSSRAAEPANGSPPSVQFW